MSQQIKRLLIANRGEIALRIQRACRELGIETVQVYSQADKESMPVRMADRAVCIGFPKASESYLNTSALIGAAHAYGADAIHPGYGFLSENADFAQLCADQDLTFVGPSAQVIRQMGDKAMARKLAMQAGVPTTPGSEDVVHDADEARRLAKDLGYPLLLKAAAGGGGRGMRIVHSEADLERAFQEASREASNAFGNGALYMERFLTDIRHIEIQILSDGETVLHLGERDCSTQRRNQKLIEESPSPSLSSDMRERIGQAAVQLARHVGYTSAGTIECILDPKANAFYFMEMNTRIQVEHPVTELVTGIDLVKQQLRIASGERLTVQQKDIQLRGHAIECRINAEDADKDFQPCPGEINRYHAPGGPGVRMDSHLYTGYRIPPYYDSLLGKLLCWGETRDEAIERMRRALDELVIDGVKTTADFHKRLVHSEAFRAGRIHTRFVENELLKPGAM